MSRNTSHQLNKAPTDVIQLIASYLMGDEALDPRTKKPILLENTNSTGWLVSMQGRSKDRPKPPTPEMLPTDLINLAYSSATMFAKIFVDGTHPRLLDLTSSNKQFNLFLKQVVRFYRRFDFETHRVFASTAIPTQFVAKKINSEQVGASLAESNRKIE